MNGIVNQARVFVANGWRYDCVALPDYCMSVYTKSVNPYEMD